MERSLHPVNPGDGYPQTPQNPPPVARGSASVPPAHRLTVESAVPMSPAAPMQPLLPSRTYGKRPKPTGFAVAAFVCGVVSILPYCVSGYPLAVVAVTLAIFARQYKKDRSVWPTLAIIAAAVGFVASSCYLIYQVVQGLKA